MYPITENILIWDLIHHILETLNCTRHCEEMKPTLWNQQNQVGIELCVLLGYAASPLVFLFLIY